MAVSILLYSRLSCCALCLFANARYWPPSSELERRFLPGATWRYSKGVDVRGGSLPSVGRLAWINSEGVF